MMKKILLLALVCFLGVQMSWAQADVISVKEYLKISKDKNVVLVSARKPADFKKVHIAGAINVYHNDLYNNEPVKSVLKPASELAKIMGAKGLNEKNKIVIYDNGSGKYSGRLYWVLKYLGVQDVKILNGHMKAWRMARKPVTKNPTKRAACTFTAKANTAILTNIASVKKALNNPKVALVDVRAAKEFNGTDESKLRKGHIPGALNLEFKQVMTSKGILKNKEELQKVFADAGITKDKEVILYCASSVRAGIVYLALTSSLNYPKVKVYEGAFYEWEKDAANTVIK